MMPLADTLTSSFKVYTPHGFAADYDRYTGAIVFTRNVDDAALFTLSNAAYVARSLGNAAILDENDRLLMIDEWTA